MQQNTDEWLLINNRKFKDDVHQNSTRCVSFYAFSLTRFVVIILFLGKSIPLGSQISHSNHSLEDLSEESYKTISHGGNLRRVMQHNNEL